MKTHKFTAAGIVVVYRELVKMRGKFQLKENEYVASQLFTTTVKVPGDWNYDESQIESVALITARMKLQERFLQQLERSPVNYGLRASRWVVEVKGVTIRPYKQTDEEEPL